jgi:hypothetical protein
MLNYDYFFAFFWGLAVLGAFIGYGRLFSHLCGWEKKESLGWGMQAALDAENSIHDAALHASDRLRLSLPAPP